MPDAASFCARSSHTLRWRLHWCRSRTPGPGPAAAKYVAFSLILSGVVRSTTAGAGSSFAEHATARRIVNTKRVQICRRRIKTPAVSLPRLESERNGPAGLSVQYSSVALLELA